MNINFLQDKITNLLRSFAPQILALILTVILLANVDIINRVISCMGHGYILMINDDYLDKAEQNIGETLLVLTSLKSFLSVLESSVAGVSFIVEAKVGLGKIVTSLQTNIDYAIIASLFSLSVVTATDLLLRLSTLLSSAIIEITILAVGMYYMIPRCFCSLRKVTIQLRDLFVLLLLLTHLMLPLAVYGAHLISLELTRPISQRAHQNLQKIHVSLLQDNGQSLDEHVKSTVQHSYTMSPHFAENGYLLSKHLVKYIVATIFDTLVFPVILLLIMLNFSRNMMDHILYDTKVPNK